MSTFEFGQPFISCFVNAKQSETTDRSMKKSIVGADTDDDRASLDCFPEEIVLQILKKIIDLKTLCICKLVTKDVSSIVLQVDTISFTTPLINPNPIKSFLEIHQQYYETAARYPSKCESFKSAMKSLNSFKFVKSLCIQLPFSCLEAVDNRFLFKWKLKFGNKKVAPYVFILSPNLVCDSKGKTVDEETDEFMKELIPPVCLSDATVRHRILLCFLDDFPLLEKISITDSGKKGRISVSCGRKIHQLRNKLGNNTMDVMSQCYIPELKLPVSGYLMKGVTLVLMHRKNDTFENVDFDDDFEDEEEVAYTEAMKEIVKKHSDKLVKNIVSE